MRTYKKCLSIFLAILTILTTLSVATPVFAESNLFANASVSDELTAAEEMTSKIVREATEFREEYVKHFICEDGSYIAATYSDPVHYKENGTWKEIDNNLRLSADVKSSAGKAMYTPKAGTVDVKIPQNFENGQKVLAANKGYTISFGANHDKIIYKNKPVATVKEAEALSSSKLTDKAEAVQESTVSNESEITAFNNNAMAVRNQTGAVVYENVFGSTDLEYIVTTNSIKENIIVNQKQNKYTYSFDMDFGELVPVVNEDNSIRLVDPENTDETIFYLAAPYMYDANGTKSYDIDMSLIEKDGKYVMTLQADVAWINASERAFPVIIDPTVYFSFDDVFVMDGIPNKNTTKINDELRIGRNLANLTRTYIKPTLPSNIPAGSYINSAHLKLTKDYYYQLPLENNISVRAYDCYDVKSWNPANITWENQPYSKSNNGYSSGHSCLSSVAATSSKTSYSFDITNAVKRWFNGGINNGIMLASSDESSKTQIDFNSSRASSSGNHPQMYIVYTAPSLSISSWEADSQSNEKTFKITTGNNWTAYTSADWISLNAVSGTPVNGYSTNKIIVSENTSVLNRTGTVTVKFGNTVIGTINVTQYGANPYLTLGTAALSFESGNNKQTLSIQSNTTWSFGELPDWITVTPSSGSENASVEVEVTQNHGTAARECNVTVTADTVTQTVHISQAYDNVPPAAPNLYEEGGLVYISSNSADFDASQDSPEHVEYKLENGEWIDYEDPLAVIRSYDATIYARTCDVAGNISEISSLVLKCELGEYTTSYTDIAFGEGVLPIGFDRTYSSEDGWFFTFQANIAEYTNGYVFTDFYGNKQYYIVNDEGKYVSAYGEELKVEEGTLLETNYSYVVPYGDLECYFNEDGKLAIVKDNYNTATYSWSNNNVYITDEASNTNIIRLSGGKPVYISASRFDAKTNTTLSKNVQYQWTDGKLTKFIDAANIEHNYTYTNGLLTTNEDETIAYSEDGRVKKITQPNGSFVKYVYEDNAASNNAETPENIGRAVVSDSKGVTDFWYYADGFEITNAISKYSDKAVYHPDNIDGTFGTENIADVAYALSYAEASDVEEIPEHPKNSDPEQPLFVKNGDKSYTFYAYDGNGRVLQELDVSQKAITVTQSTTFTDAKAVANKMTVYVYEGEDIVRETVSERNSENVLAETNKTEYTYFESGELNTLYEYKKAGSQWQLVLSERYGVNGNTLLRRELTYGDEVKEEKTEFTYDEDDRLLTQITQTKTGGGDFTNTAKTDISYNSAGDVLTKTVSQGISNVWHQTSCEEYEYNDYGNNTKQIVTLSTNKINDETGAVETVSNQTVTLYCYDVWNQCTGAVENAGQENEQITSIVYDILGRVTLQTADGKTTTYTYDSRDNVTKIIAGEETTVYSFSENGNLTSRTNPNNTVASYVYDNYGNLTNHSYNGYSFSYNTLGSILEAKIGEQTIVAYTYSADTKQDVLTADFGNNQSVVNVYNADNELESIKLGDTEKYGYAYEKDEDGNITKTTITDTVNNLVKVLEESKLTVKKANGEVLYSVENHVKDDDVENSFDGRVEKAAYERYTIKYEDDYDEFIGEFSYYKKKYESNDDGDVTKTSIICGNGGLCTETVYGYNSDKNISTLKNIVTGLEQTYSYVYDDNGNITGQSLTTASRGEENQTVEATDTTTYSYDNYNQLTAVENDSTRWEYTYDGRGNILSKNEKAVTLDDNNEKVYTLKESGTDSYSYDSTWQDKLVSYNGQSITYDAMGNPTSYLVHNLSWTMGRQLASFDDITYTYNENGIRTSKTVNEKTTLYYLDGTRLIETSDGANRIHINYDRNGEAIGFTHFYFGEREGDDPCAANYTYIKNAQGDITGIANIYGNVCVKYTYDPWGKLIGIESDFSQYDVDVSELNPLRYRGYVYDDETGLYYLQSRYYDPEVCRFINCDNVNYIGIAASELSYNAFAYCENDCINECDPYGNIKFRKGAYFDEFTSYYYGGDDYTYNPKVKPSLKNKFMSSAWKIAATAVKRIYPDGYSFYMHYVNGKGKPYLYDYGKAIKDDVSIRNSVNNIIDDFIKYIKRQNIKDGNTHGFSSVLDKEVGATPKTFNWKLAIGTHLITVAATVKYFKSERRCNAVVIVLAYDRYNFSSGIKFAGLIPGNWNGELVTCGLAQNYTSFGLYITSISWR